MRHAAGIRPHYRCSPVSSELGSVGFSVFAHLYSSKASKVSTYGVVFERRHNLLADVGHVLHLLLCQCLYCCTSKASKLCTSTNACRLSTGAWWKKPCRATRQHTSAYVSIRQHSSAFVSIRQHTSAYVSIRQLEEAQPAAHRQYFIV